MFKKHATKKGEIHLKMCWYGKGIKTKHVLSSSENRTKSKCKNRYYIHWKCGARQIFM